MPNIYPTTGRPRTKGRTKLRDKSLLNPNAKKPIDLLHKTQQEKFKTELEQLDSINLEIKNLEKKLININKDITTLLSTGDIPNLNLEKERWDTEDKIKNLNTKKYDIENNTKAKKYLLKSGQILYQYKKIKNSELLNKNFIGDRFEDNYESDNNATLNTKDKLHNDVHTGKNTNNQTNKNKDDNSNSNVTTYTMLDNFLVKGSNNVKYKSTLKTNSKTNKLNYDFSINDIKQNCNTKTKNIKNNTSNNINDDITNNKTSKNLLKDYLKVDKEKEELNKHKKKIYTKYMKLLDSNYVDMTKDNSLCFDICIHCKKEMVLNHNSGMIQCQNCGISEKIIVNTDKQSHKEPPKEITAFSYQRINHINEIISQLQGKQSTDIPKEIFQKIQNELNKMKIPIENVNKTLIKEILKKINANKYYEHSVYIMNQLGVPKTTFSREVEEILRELFKQVEPVFEKYCPSTRKNFLKYEYFFYKLFEL